MKTKLSIIIAALCLFFSCDNIGLGKKLNLEPPVVSIDKPDFMQNVGAVLEITGTATDKEEIVSLTVTVERASETGESWKQEWRGESGTWRSRNMDSPWESQSGAGIIWDNSRGKGNILWTITLSMEGAPDGEYLISAGAVNNVSNAGALQQRRVIIDITPPVVNVVNPLLEADEDELDQYAHLRDSAVLDRLHNRKITIQYEIKDDFSIDTLAFLLLDEDGNFYYNHYDNGECDTYVSGLGWSGKFDILAEDIVYPQGHPLAGEPVGMDQLDVENGLRLQLISVATDKAGNGIEDDITKFRNHGWLIYWPDADRPWIEGAGNIDPPDRSDAFRVFPGSEVQGQAYDNNGVGWVSYTIYTYDRVSGNRGAQVPDKGDTKYQDTLFNIPLEEGSAPSTFFNWNFTAPEETGDYVIDIECMDINDPGIAGLPASRYFYVYDIHPPSVDVDEPDPNETLWGDKDGNFSISGTAEDGVNPVKLTLVWINPAGDWAESLMEYSSADFSGWGTTAAAGSSPGTAGAAYSDSSNPAAANKIWEFNMDGPGTPAGSGNRMLKTFAIDLNLFNDLGIGALIPLKDQYFILRVQGESGRAVSLIHKVQGDMVPPVIAITQISITRDGDPIEKSPFDPAYLKDSSIPALQPGDKVTISGTWSDNSLSDSDWKNAASAWQPAKHMGALSVSWNGAAVGPAALDINETWTAGPLTLNSAQAALAGAIITASLQDLGANSAEFEIPATVDTNVPRLMLISADQESRSFGAGITINIYLEFNKPVTFTGTAATLPSLTLSNNAVVPARSFDPADPASKYYFDYKINSDDDNTPEPGPSLTVISINLPADTAWEAGGIPAATDTDNLSLNLRDTREIRVDTEVPSITKVESLSGYKQQTSYFKEGAEVFLLVTFDEPIKYTAGSTATSLTLNVDTNGGWTTVSSHPQYPQLSGDSALQFLYKVPGTHNTPFGSPDNYTGYLSASALTLGTGAKIEDIAGNTISTGTITIGGTIPNIDSVDSGSKQIVIDTTVPGQLTVNGIVTAGSVIEGGVTVGVAKDTQTFTLGGGETGATLEYSINGIGGPWLPYPASGGKELSAAMTYQLSARQIDRAGNASSPSTPLVFKIERKPPLVQSLGGSPTGTYTYTPSPNETAIEVHLKLREEVTVSGSPIITLLSGSWTRTAVFVTTTNPTDTLEFRYTVQQGDGQVGPLELSTINLNGATLTAGGVDVTDELKTSGWNTAEPRLSTFTKIFIDTVLPVFQPSSSGLNADGTSLTLSFSKPVSKNTGNIIIEQTANTYNPPAVLTKDEFQNWGGIAGATAPNNIGYFYEKGTNGTNAAGVTDTAEKYILKYAIEPSDATLRNLLTGSGSTINAHRISVPVVSSAVTINGGMLTVTLNASTGYELRVKGAQYNVYFPHTLVQDNLNNIPEPGTYTFNSVSGYYNTAPSTITGVNAPFIRIRKERTVYDPSTTPTGNLSEGGAWLHRTTTARIDTQTPGAQIWYVLNTSGPSAAYAGNFPATDQESSPNVNMNAGNLSSYTGQITLGNTTTTDLNGYVYGIRAEARKAPSTSPLVYEKAVRTVVQFTNTVGYRDNTNNTTTYNGRTDGWGTLGDAAGAGKTLQLWIRGGDGLVGSNKTVGLPLSWNEQDYGGARLMSRTAGETWAWISWEVSVPVYIHFIAGTTTTIEQAANGPHEWTWSKNAWTAQQKFFPLHPGRSLSFSPGTYDNNGNTYNQESTYVDDQPVGAYGFFSFFTGSR